MYRSIPRSWLRLLASAVLVSCAWGGAAAQLKGHNISGDFGLQSGTQAPPGIYLVNANWIYPTDTIKNDRGDKINQGGGSLTSLFVAGGLSYVTDVKILGGTLGGTFIVPVIKNRIQTNALDVNTPLAFSDIYWQPAHLGWHLKRADVIIGYGIFFPTGKFQPGGSENSGLGMVSHEISGGATLHLDEKKSWSLAALLSYEIHGRKRGIDQKVGDLVTIEGGLGKTFYKKVNNPLPLIINIGAVGYTQFKATGDSGTALPVVLRGLKDRVFGAGPEFNIFIPQARLTVAVRYIPEFGARNRTQGQTILVSVAFVAKSLIPHRPAPGS